MGTAASLATHKGDLDRAITAMSKSILVPSSPDNKSHNGLFT